MLKNDLQLSYNRHLKSQQFQRTLCAAFTPYTVVVAACNRIKPRQAESVGL